MNHYHYYKYCFIKIYFSINNIKINFCILKNFIFLFELIIIDDFTLILSLNNNPDLINSIKIGLILNS